MFKKDDRVTILSDIVVSGVNPGDTATINSITLNERFYPVQLRLDKPCDDGHYYYRVDYADIRLIEEKEPVTVVEPLDWMDVPVDAEIPL